MSDDSYHPEEEISPAEGKRDEGNYLEEIAQLMPLPMMMTVEDYSPVTPSPGALSKSITGKRRQKSLQFVTTEMVFLIMREERERHSTEVNPSLIAEQLHITRRRIYDIVHVMNCLDLLHRYSYRVYNWEGLASMQRHLARLYATPFDAFESCFAHCFKKTKESRTEEKSEDTTAKNITIKFLKYLFLYIKSGRTTFNNHDLTSLVVRELHHNDSRTLTPTAKRASHEKDKSIERRLYDIISVLCGMGIIKRRSDSTSWVQSSLDSVSEQRDHTSYYKGNNMMICLAHYLERDDDLAMTVKMGDVWDMLYRIFLRSGMVLVVDIDSVKDTLSNEKNLCELLKPSEEVALGGIPAVPGSSVAWGVAPEAVLLTANHVRVNGKREDTTQHKRKRERRDEDEEWKMPYKRPSHEKESASTDPFMSVLPDQDIPNLFDYTAFAPAQITTPSRQHQLEEASSPPSLIHLSNLVSPIRENSFLLTSPSHDINLFSYLQSPQIGILSPSLRKGTPGRQENYRRAEMPPPFFDTVPIALPVLPAVPAFPVPSEDPIPAQTKSFQISPSNVLDTNPSVGPCAKGQSRTEK